MKTLAIIANDPSRHVLPASRRPKSHPTLKDCSHSMGDFVAKPLRCEDGHSSPPHFEYMKLRPDLYSALLIGQIPDTVTDDQQLLAVFQYMLEDLDRGAPVIFAWDRFNRERGCGAMWVPIHLKDRVIEALDCRVRIDGQNVFFFDSADRRQPDDRALRRITCVVKHNIRKPH